MTCGSLFAGIGGLELGLERAGIEVRWQVEKDDYCRRVLAKHWPDVPRYGDIRDVMGRGQIGHRLYQLEQVDLICGGFPCTDISSSGNKVGIGGEHSGLWREFARIVREIRPAYVVVENVSDLLHRGVGDTLGDLAALGYDAEWDVLPACAFGLPQRRERVFVIAHTDRGRLEVSTQRHGSGAFGARWVDGNGLVQAEHRAAEATGRIRRMDDGLPGTVDRLRALGNAVVPQVAEYIGRRIMSGEASA